MRDNGLKVGMVGAGRGLSFSDGFVASGVRIAAVCDSGADALDRFTAAFPSAQRCADFGEDEYTHDFKLAACGATWRRFWLLGRPGGTYITHSLGPVLRWFNAARGEEAPLTIAAVSCLGSGRHYCDSNGVPYETDDVNQ